MSTHHAAKQSFRSRVVPGILRRLRRIGVVVEPFLVVREGEQAVDPDLSKTDYDFGFLTEADIDELIRLEPNPTCETVREWFREGKLCFGVKDGPRVLAKMWCDIKSFNYPPNFRELAGDEVYLYAAYADPAYRGRNLVPMMRDACYASLRQMGRVKFLSYTEYYNYAARRFKAKLGARDEVLRLHLGLFGLWSKTMTLKHY